MLNVCKLQLSPDKQAQAQAVIESASVNKTLYDNGVSMADISSYGSRVNNSLSISTINGKSHSIAPVMNRQFLLQNQTMSGTPSKHNFLKNEVGGLPELTTTRSKEFESRPAFDLSQTPGHIHKYGLEYQINPNSIRHGAMHEVIQSQEEEKK